MDWKFIITTIISVVSVVIAFLQYHRKKNEEKKVEALKVLLGSVKGWQSYIQSAANANTLLRNHIRGKTDEGREVTKFSSLADVESAVETNGAFLNGLHTGVERELEEINRVLKENK